MSLTFAVQYRDGVATPLDGQALGPHDDGRIVWIDLNNPTRAELEELGGRFGLHPLEIREALTSGEVPKAEPLGETLFVVARTASQTGDSFGFGQIAIFVGAHHVISVARDGAPDHGAVRASLEKLPELFAFGVDYILHGLFNAAIGSLAALTEAYDEEVTALEATIPQGSLSQERILRLLTLRRRTKRLERILKPMEETARKLAKGDLPLIREDLTVYFRDLVDRVERIEAVCASVQDGLASVFEYSALLEQQRTGNVARQLAAWAAILAVPTAIAGIYGMNFENMPGVDWRYGYAVCLGVIVLVSGLLFWRFRKLGWL